MSLNVNQSPVITDADAPLNHSKADVILRSADNVDFRVFKSILSLASPIFDDMFALPQGPGEDNSNEMKDGLPVVQLTEDKKTLEMLLLMCYPMAAVDLRDPETLSETHLLLDAAIKYNVERVEKRVRRWVRTRFLDTDPLQVFAIACHYQLEAEARLAAAATTFKPMMEWPYGEELNLITAWQLHQLMRYHKRGVEAVSRLFIDFTWIKQKQFCWFTSGCGCIRLHKIFGPGRCQKSVCSWWCYYMEDVAEALKDGLWDEAKNDSLIEMALRRADTNCGDASMGMARHGLQEFKNILLAGIQDALSKVPLDLPFSSGVLEKKWEQKTVPV